MTEDRKVVLLSAVCGVIGLAALLLELSWPGLPKTLLPTVALTFAALLATLRGGLRDPQVIFVTASALYAGLPAFVMPQSGTLNFGVTFTGGYYIASAGMLATMFGVGIATSLVKDSGATRIGGDLQDPSLLKLAASIAATLSVFLTLVFLAKNGAVATGARGYNEMFLIRRQAGNGLFMFAVPLAVAAICLTFTARGRTNLFLLAAALSAFGLLYVAHGSRRYIIIPFLIGLAAKLRIKRLWQTAALVVLAPAALTTFSYGGYLRTAGVSLDQALSMHALEQFAARSSAEILGGETVVLYSTAAAAYNGKVDALPLAGDYFLAPLYALPNLLSRGSFTTMNDRFAIEQTRAAYYNGGGWGFSFYGEAYAVGGFAMIFAIVVIVLCVMRMLFLKARSAQFHDLYGSVALAALPALLWMHRNAFAYFFREFVIYQVGAILLVCGAGYCFLRLVRDRSHSAPSVLKHPRHVQPS